MLQEMKRRLFVLRWWLASLTLLFRRPARLDAVVTAADDSIVPVAAADPVVPVPKIEPRKSPKNISIRWHLKSAILDRLDEYFACIRRVRRHDPASYQLFSRVGMAISESAYANGDREIPLSLPRLSFGGMLMPHSDPDQIAPSFIYFRKLKSVPRVETCSGDCYEVTVFYDDRGGKSDRWRSLSAHPATFYVSASSDGSVKLLRTLVTMREAIQCNTTSRRHKFELTRRKWQTPGWVEEIASSKSMTAEHWATWIFRMAFVTYCECIGGLVVRVKRGADIAAFGIDTSTAKSFFADRGMTALATDGRRKRIFHAVVGHQRVIGLERTIEIKSHYRGIRHFDWRGFSIRIVHPKNVSLLTFPTAAMPLSKIPKGRGVDERGLSDLFAPLLDS